MPALRGWVGPWIAFAVLAGWRLWVAITPLVPATSPYVYAAAGALLGLTGAGVVALTARVRRRPDSGGAYAPPERCDACRSACGTWDSRDERREACALSERRDACRSRCAARGGRADLAVLLVFAAAGWLAGARATDPGPVAAGGRGPLVLSAEAGPGPLAPSGQAGPGPLAPSAEATYHAVEVDRAGLDGWRGRIVAMLVAGEWRPCTPTLAAYGGPGPDATGCWILEGEARPQPPRFPRRSGEVRVDPVAAYRFTWGDGAESGNPAIPPKPRASARAEAPPPWSPAAWASWSTEYARARDATRASVVARWREILGERMGGFAGWVLLGVRPEFADFLREPFVRTGTSHLLAISGLHVGMVAGAVWVGLRLAMRSPRRARRLTAVVLLLYAALTGGAVSVLRAAGMYFLVALGPAWGRSGRAWNALGWAAALLPLVWPEVPGRPTFVLSVAATAGVLLGARVADLLPRGVRLRGLISGAAASFGAQCGTWAMSLHFFALASTSGLLVNLAAIPLAGVAVPVLLAAGVVALLPGAHAELPVVVLGRALGETLLSAIGVSSRVPGMVLGALSEWQATTCTAISLTALWALGRLREARAVAPIGAMSARAAESGPAAECASAAESRQGSTAPTEPTAPFGTHAGITHRLVALSSLRARVVTCVAVAVLAGFVLPTWGALRSAAPVSGLRVTFLDVGQGDAILVETLGQRWLYDTGPPPGRRLVRALQEAGVSRLNRVFLTHGDQDHWGGLLALLASPIQVDTLSISAGGPWPARFWDTLAAAGAGQGFPVPPVKRPVVDRVGLGWERGDARVRCRALHPMPGFVAEGRNDHSIVLAFEDGAAGPEPGRCRILLIGDIEESAQRALLHGLARDATVGDPGDVEESALPVLPDGPPRDASPRVPRADVVQAGHHGSRTSLAPGWYDAVAPRAVVASLARGNRYGFPHEEVIAELAARGAPLWRTDERGAIGLAWDGERWTVRSGGSAPWSARG